MRLTDQQYDLLEERGVDYDLRACLEYNCQNFDVFDIIKVLAVHEGENDEEYWRWILQLVDNTYVIMEGWCDYTGRDCQSGADSKIFNSLDELILDVDIVQDIEVMKELIEQLNSTKKLTWTEKTNVLLNVDK